MSDSQEMDSPRKAWQEWIKGWIVRNGSAALVAGRRHREYAMTLGMPADQIAEGYDVVDNEYFIERSDAIRFGTDNPTAGQSLPRCYLLASARFVPKKNLFRLLDAFADARRQLPEMWSLVILGDGELRFGIEARIQALGIEEWVLLPGFKQYDELPVYFGRAEAFVLASTTEQWGLVVNEAMASALPVLVSERCGCAPDLVIEGETGFTFPPEDVTALSERMLRVMRMPPEERRCMGEAARRQIVAFSPEVFATTAMALANTVVNAPEKGKSYLAGNVLLPALAWAADH